VARLPRKRHEGRRSALNFKVGEAAVAEERVGDAELFVAFKKAANLLVEVLVVEVAVDGLFFKKSPTPLFLFFALTVVVVVVVLVVVGVVEGNGNGKGVGVLEEGIPRSDSAAVLEGSAMSSVMDVRRPPPPLFLRSLFFLGGGPEDGSKVGSIGATIPRSNKAAELEGSPRI
tara:strand:+ start:1105 stop:1623 length:519 start_codon:yes stop_codon:yes gene_type:complete